MDENIRLCDHPLKLWMTFLLRNGHSKPPAKGAACPQGKGCPRCSCYVYHADQVKNRNDLEISLALSLKRIWPLITKHKFTNWQEVSNPPRIMAIARCSLARVKSGTKSASAAIAATGILTPGPYFFTTIITKALYIYHMSNNLPFHSRFPTLILVRKYL